MKTNEQLILDQIRKELKNVEHFQYSIADYYPTANNRFRYVERNGKLIHQFLTRVYVDYSGFGRLDTTYINVWLDVPVEKDNYKE